MKKANRMENNGSPIKPPAAAIVDDDLPPRMETPKASPKPESTSLPNTGRNTPISSRPSTPQGSLPASNLPIQAGFDLKAIKEVLKEVKHDADTKPPSTLIPKRSSLSNLVSPQFLHRPNSLPESYAIPETSSHQRSNSVGDGYAVVVPPELDRGPRTAGFTNDDFVGTPRGQTHSLFLSNLPGDAVPSWGASTGSVNTPATAKPFSTSFSRLPSPALGSVNFNNPFASPGHDRTPVLSFGIGGEVDAKSFDHRGGADGGMAWELPPLGTGKKATTVDTALGTNPWS